MRFNDGSHDGQSEADAADRRFASSPCKLGEQCFLLARRQTRPVVLDTDLDIPARTLRRDGDDTAGWRVFRGILQKVAEDPLHQDWVEIEHGQVGWQRDIDRVSGQHRGAGLKGHADDFFQGLPVAIQFDVPALQASHVQQIADQHTGAQRLVADGVGDVGLCFRQGRPGDMQGLGQAGEHGQRRAQIMRQRGQQ